MTCDTTRHFWLGLLVIMALTTTASHQESFFDDFSAYRPSDKEARRHCGLRIPFQPLKVRAPQEESDGRRLQPPRFVDLNAPGELPTLQQTNSGHSTAVLKILDEVLLHPAAAVVTVDGHGVDYPNILLTSNPPKRRLSFTVDDTHYVALITLAACGPVVPLR